MRYLPELTAKLNLGRTWTLDLDASANAFVAEEYLDGNRLGETQSDVELYRGSVRVASPRFEARAGLQKISFGSAAVFRPEMWFDRVDPRDPLQFSEGVYAFLLRYYVAGRANVWAWGLYGNDEPKGWELLPSDDNTPELGGRVQVPVPRGEIAAQRPPPPGGPRRRARPASRPRRRDGARGPRGLRRQVGPGRGRVGRG